MAILEVNSLQKIYTTRLAGNQVQALSDVSFSVNEGEYIAIMGESGSGKTTLLNILAALDKPTSGMVLLNGKNIVEIPEKEMSAFRRDNLGFVFQDFNLLDTFDLKDKYSAPPCALRGSLSGNDDTAAPHRGKTGNRRSAFQISLRGVRRTETAGGSRQSADYRASANSCR